MQGGELRRLSFFKWVTTDWLGSWHSLCSRTLLGHSWSTVFSGLEQRHRGKGPREATPVLEPLEWLGKALSLSQLTDQREEGGKSRVLSREAQSDCHPRGMGASATRLPHGPLQRRAPPPAPWEQLPSTWAFRARECAQPLAVAPPCCYPHRGYCDLAVVCPPEVWELEAWSPLERY